MRLILLSDRSLATRERAMLRRLEVGLVDEGCRVVRLFPDGTELEATTGVEAAFAYPDAGWRIGPLSPVRAIERRLSDLAALPDDDDGRVVDIIHAIGCASWTLALALAGSTGADLVLDVHSRAALAHVQSLERRSGSLGVSGVWLAPDDTMQRAAERLARRWPVRAGWWGVHVPPIEEIVKPASAPIESVCVIAGDDDPAPVIHLLSALARAPDQPMIFLDARAVETHPQVWRHAGSMNLLSRLTVVADMESRRDLLLRVDAVISADCRGEHSTLLLETMASAIPVIARSDRLVAVCTDPSIAILIDEPSEAGWSRALTSLLGSPADAREIGLAARRYIQKSRLAHLQVRAALDAYAQLIDPEPIPLRPA